MTFIRLPESLRPSVGSREPLWLVSPTVLAVELVVWMEAESSLLDKQSIELITVLVDLGPDSA